MAAAAGRYDASLEFVSFPRGPFLLSAGAGPRVLARIRALDPDVVVLDSIAAAFAALWLPRVNLPVAAIVHQSPGGVGHSWPRSRIQAGLDVAAYRRADITMVASASLVPELKARGISGRRIRVVPPGRDVTKTPLGRLPELRAGRKVALLCVANWTPRKGLIDLLDTVVRLPPDLATLHFVGDDRVNACYARALRRRLLDVNLRDRVVVHGLIPSLEVARMYAAADIFVLPSMQEAYGTVFAEAMAAGLPVVGWHSGNLPHLADDGVEGLVVPTGDIEGLTHALKTISEDDGLRSRMASNARDRARKFPTWEQTSEAFFGALRALVATKNAGRD
jgi:glycosyltransferase involved in cell wall biosynthesis